MIKTITWYNLWKRLGKQPIHKTEGQKVIIVDKNGDTQNLNVSNGK